MSFVPRFIARQCARGTAQLAKDATKFQTISLFNSSPGPYYIVVRDFYAWVAGGFNIFSDLVSGAQGALAMQGVPIVPGEASPAGAVYTQLVTTQPNPDYEIMANLDTSPGWKHGFPFTILLPGWSLRFTCDTANQGTMFASFLWQWVLAQDIDGSFADLEMNLASG